MAHPYLIGLLGPLLALGCANGEPPVKHCMDDSSPTLTLGTGETEFVPLVGEPPELELVHGPQGGYHLVIGFQTKNLDSIHFITARMVGFINGEQLAITERWQDFDCNRQSNRLESFNAYLIYDAPRRLSGSVNDHRSVAHR